MISWRPTAYHEHLDAVHKEKKPLELAARLFVTAIIIIKFPAKVGNPVRSAFRKQQVCGSTQKETVNHTGWRSSEKRCVCVPVCVFMQCQRDVMLIINNIAFVGLAWRSQSLTHSVRFSRNSCGLCVLKRKRMERDAVRRSSRVTPSCTNDVTRFVLFFSSDELTFDYRQLALFFL